jgi:hypothetical protein
MGTMNPHQIIEWTHERVAELREMVKTMSAGQIAMKWDVSRNTICGKMDRLGMRRPQRNGSLAPITLAPNPPRGPADIWQLTGSSCRYPLWHDSEPIHEKFYCGNKVVEGAVYCDCHAKVCFSGWAV